MKTAKPGVSDDLRPEYHREDLGKGVRGKYFAAYQKGTNLVLLNPDIAKAFPTPRVASAGISSEVRKGRK